MTADGIKIGINKRTDMDFIDSSEMSKYGKLDD